MSASCPPPTGKLSTFPGQSVASPDFFGLIRTRFHTQSPDNPLCIRTLGPGVWGEGGASVYDDASMLQPNSSAVPLLELWNLRRPHRPR